MASRQTEPGDSPLLPPPVNPSSSPPLSQSTTLILPGPSYQTRACTHAKLTRLYDHFECYRCSLCGRTAPEVPFLWRCTADTDGFLPESDFTDQPAQKIITTPIPSTTVLSPTMENLDPAVRKFLQEGTYTVEQLNTVPHLSASSIKGIGERHYTHDQVKKLIEQKRGVWRAIRQDLGAESRPTTGESSATAAESSIFTRTATLPTSTTLSTVSTAPDDELRRAYNWRAVQRVFGEESNEIVQVNPYLPRDIQQAQRFDRISTPPSADFAAEAGVADHVPALDASNARVTSHIVPCCNFKVCPVCRPSMRERGVPSIDTLVSNPVSPPLHEMRNRPIANAAVMKDLGQRERSPQSLPAKLATPERESMQSLRAEPAQSQREPAQSRSENPTTPTRVKFHQSLHEDEYAAKEDYEAQSAAARDDYIARVSEEYAERAEWDSYFHDNLNEPKDKGKEKEVVEKDQPMQEEEARETAPVTEPAAVAAASAEEARPRKGFRAAVRKAFGRVGKKFSSK